VGRISIVGAYISRSWLSSSREHLLLKRRSPTGEAACLFANGWSKRAPDALAPDTVADGPNELKTREILLSLVDQGIIVVTQDFTYNNAGTYVDGWGAPSVVDLVSTVVANATDDPDHDAGIVVVAASMGALVAFNYLLDLPDPSIISAVALLNPVTNLEYIHDNAGQPLLQASLDIVYADETARNASSPILNIAAIDLCEVPIKIWYSGNDTTVDTGSITTFISNSTMTTGVNVGNTDHDIDEHPTSDIIAWLMGKL
jgi:pimeloyl-ACP methyl ester carboxylesterase